MYWRGRLTPPPLPLITRTPDALEGDTVKLKVKRLNTDMLGASPLSEMLQKRLVATQRRGIENYERYHLHDRSMAMATEILD
eukprot:COSAG01_NODE_5198_length_4416_cov_9.375029_4_plen_82_part_00